MTTMSTEVIEALQAVARYPHGIPTPGPTDRAKECADKIKKGMAVEQAMAEAGYGRKFIAGRAKAFPLFLAKAGLLTDTQAAKAIGATLTPEPVKPEKKEAAK